MSGAGVSSSTFTSQTDLKKFLTRLGSHYEEYAPKLWDYGVRSTLELAHASAATLQKAGVTNDLHVDNIKASAAKEASGAGAGAAPADAQAGTKSEENAQAKKKFENEISTGRDVLKELSMDPYQRYLYYMSLPTPGSGAQQEPPVPHGQPQHKAQAPSTMLRRRLGWASSEQKETLLP